MLGFTKTPVTFEIHGRSVLKFPFDFGALLDNLLACSLFQVKGFRYEYFLLSEYDITLHVVSLWAIVFNFGHDPIL